MNNTNTDDFTHLIEKATGGDKDSLETVILSVRDLIFNISLRMLGSFHDAEDATQDIILKIITHLSSFKHKSAFSTWVFRIATNHLINYKKHMFSKYPLSFEFYGDDIENAQTQDIPDLTQNVETAILEEELKMSCTNVMLQCLDMESRCIFILGTMFKVDSRIAGDILEITADTYRQRLSRVRRKMADFLSAYCGEYGSGKCQCKDRINYAIQSQRVLPKSLEYTKSSEISQDKILNIKKTMEEIDDISVQFSFLKLYESTEKLKQFLREFVESTSLSIIKNF